MSELFSAIRTGAARPVRIPPGEASLLFVRNLFNEAGRHLQGQDAENFRLVRATCQCANDASTRGRHEEAARWIGLTHRLLQGLAGEARMASFSCIKSNESFVHYSSGDFPRALACLDDAMKEESGEWLTSLDGSSAGRRTHLWYLRHFHYLHLRGRIYLEAKDPAAAVGQFIDALKDSNLVAATEENIIELLHYSCSRIAGELAITAGVSPSPQEYLAMTEAVTRMPTEGSVTEFLFFRNAYRALKEENKPDEMADFVSVGRKKTICWYAAVVELAPLLGLDERRAVTVQSATWRDMPARLRGRLIATLPA